MKVFTHKSTVRRRGQAPRISPRSRESRANVIRLAGRESTSDTYFDSRSAARALFGRLNILVVFSMLNIKTALSDETDASCRRDPTSHGQGT
ncbi:hypothetical protein EVAR_33176_1 [Eumeta japonica]|uniref:Uncharacterized protein n=1 Tax=Eumeta variegata TaxID=151549 RepID=A0A4C1W1Y0_EUMVA|nr:hypothetical protein EVAR_33176_1 [Eumeta japonica]